MVNQFSQQPVKPRMALLVFINGSAAPIVMYLENPVTVYEELKKIVETAFLKQNKSLKFLCL